MVLLLHVVAFLRAQSALKLLLRFQIKRTSPFEVPVRFQYPPAPIDHQLEQAP